MHGMLFALGQHNRSHLRRRKKRIFGMIISDDLGVQGIIIVLSNIKYRMHHGIESAVHPSLPVLKEEQIKKEAVWGCKRRIPVIFVPQDCPDCENVTTSFVG